MLIPRRGIEYFGNLAFVGGGGGGDGGAKGRAAIGYATQIVPSSTSRLIFSATPKYDVLGEVDVDNSRFVADSDGYYLVYSAAEFFTPPFTGKSYNLSLAIRKEGVGFSSTVEGFTESQPDGLFVHVESVVPLSTGESVSFFHNFAIESDLTFNPEKSYAEFAKL